MNAITAHAHVSTRHASADDATLVRRRRRAIIGTVAAAFLGAYVLGVSWFASELTTDMERNLQLAPAVQDVAHR